MKRLSFLIVSLLAVTMFTACNDNGDEPINKQTVTMTINNRAVDGDQVVFSQNTAKVEINYTDMMIQFNTEYKDAAEHSHSIATPMMKLTNESGTIYSFGKGTSDISGYIDFATGMTWFIIPDNGNHFSHEQSAYLFALDSKCEKCIMKIGNFIPNMAGSVEMSEVQFNDVDVTPTATGYTITASEVESTVKTYTITDLNINIDNQCLSIIGSFKCKDLEFAITGKLFPNVSYVPF